MNYLYTAAWGRFLSLSESLEPNLVVNILRYLDLVSKTIDKISVTARETIIEGNRESYSANINKKIDEITGFIDNDILPAIRNASEGMTKDIGQLITEVVKMMNDTAKDEKELSDKKVRLDL